MLHAIKNRLFVTATLVLTLSLIPASVISQEKDPAEILLEKVLTIYNGPNLDAIPEVYSKDIILHHSSFPEPIQGIEAFTKFVKKNADSFSDFTLTIEKLWATEDLYWSFWKATGTNDGEIDGKSATGNKVEIWGMSASKVVFGRIVEEWIVFNQLTMINQLKADPPPELPQDAHK